MVGHPTPAEVDPTGATFCFEKGAAKAGSAGILPASGFADVWKRDFFGIEYKGRNKRLDAAYDQLLLYRDALESPPLLVVCDLDRIVPFPFGGAGVPPASEEAGGMPALRQAIADAARGPDDARRNWIGDRTDKTRTLTALYNKKPTWLADAHRALDAAVCAACGCPADMTDAQILETLLALNLSRSTAEFTRHHVRRSVARSRKSHLRDGGGAVPGQHRFRSNPHFDRLTRLLSERDSREAP